MYKVQSEVATKYKASETLLSLLSAVISMDIDLYDVFISSPYITPLDDKLFEMSISGHISPTREVDEEALTDKDRRDLCP